MIVADNSRPPLSHIQARKNTRKQVKHVFLNLRRQTSGCLPRNKLIELNHQITVIFINRTHFPQAFNPKLRFCNKCVICQLESDEMARIYTIGNTLS